MSTTRIGCVAIATTAGYNKMIIRLTYLLICLGISGHFGKTIGVAQEAPEAEVAAEELETPIPSSDCLDCHSDADLTMTGADGKEFSIFVDAEPLDNSVHGGLLDCVDCHVDLTREHPDDEVPAQPVNCAECHETAAEEYTGSIHGVSQQMGASAAATCADCHGSHDMLPVTDVRSPVFKLNLPVTCAKCHSNQEIVDEYRIHDGAAPAHYLDSIHGQALLKLGLIVAPSCNDCHGVHDIKRSVDRDSPIHHLNIARTCGKCHVKVEEIYDQSVHGRLTLAGDGRGPVCTDCHSAHEIEPPVNGHFKAASDRRCGQCHQDSLTHYRDTYHGSDLESRCRR